MPALSDTRGTLDFADQLSNALVMPMPGRSTRQTDVLGPQEILRNTARCLNGPLVICSTKVFDLDIKKTSHVFSSEGRQ